MNISRRKQPGSKNLLALHRETIIGLVPVESSAGPRDAWGLRRPLHLPKLHLGALLSYNLALLLPFCLADVKHLGVVEFNSKSNVLDQITQFFFGSPLFNNLDPPPSPPLWPRHVVPWTNQRGLVIFRPFASLSIWCHLIEKICTAMVGNKTRQKVVKQYQYPSGSL